MYEEPSADSTAYNGLNASADRSCMALVIALSRKGTKAEGTASTKGAESKATQVLEYYEDVSGAYLQGHADTRSDVPYRMLNRTLTLSLDRC